MKAVGTLIRACVLVAALQGCTIHPANAVSLLVDAPSGGGGYYGMYCPTCTAASFTLAASYHVSTIDLVLRTPASTKFTTFNFTLQHSLTGPITTFASASLTAPLGGTSTVVMNVDAILPAGTYYLVGNIPGYAGTSVTPGDVDGWLISNGKYNNAAGTITDGVWAFNGSKWTLISGDYYKNGTIYYTPAFSVYGSPVGAEPLAQNAYITGTNVSVIDTATDTVATTLPIDSYGVAVAGNGSKVYVTSDAGSMVSADQHRD